MNEENTFLVVKADGQLLPMAGIWRDNEAGGYAAGKYSEKDKEVEIVRVKITETE